MSPIQTISLPPLAALLSLGSGGRITGAAHAVHKESNRLSRTVELLSCFGIKATLFDDGIEVEGNQKPISPKQPVPTFDDHRLFMTAVLLASNTGGEVIGHTLHHVADEGFVQRLLDAGVGIEATNNTITSMTNHDGQSGGPEHSVEAVNAVGRPCTQAQGLVIRRISSTNLRISGNVNFSFALTAPLTRVEECKVIFASVNRFKWCAIFSGVLQ